MADWRTWNEASVAGGQRTWGSMGQARLATSRQGWTMKGSIWNIKALNLYYNSKRKTWWGGWLGHIYTLERTSSHSTETSWRDQGWMYQDQLRSYCDILGWDDESSSRGGKRVGKKRILSEAFKLNWTGLVDALDRDVKRKVLGYLWSCWLTEQMDGD